MTAAEPSGYGSPAGFIAEIRRRSRGSMSPGQVIIVAIVAVLGLLALRRLYVRRRSIARIYERFGDMGHVVELVRPTSLRALSRKGFVPDFDRRFRPRVEASASRRTWSQRMSALLHIYFVVTTLDQQARRRHLVVATRMRMMWNDYARLQPTWYVREVGEVLVPD